MCTVWPVVMLSLLETRICSPAIVTYCSSILPDKLSMKGKIVVHSISLSLPACTCTGMLWKKTSHVTYYYCTCCLLSCFNLNLFRAKSVEWEHWKGNIIKVKKNERLSQKWRVNKSKLINNHICSQVLEEAICSIWNKQACIMSM